MKKAPVKIKELPANQRAQDFSEVVLGYSEDQMLQEASRCLQCKDPACIAGCPVGVDIKSFICQLTRQDYAAAYHKIKEKNNFPSICGRVCPAEYQCRLKCVLNNKKLPFASEEAVNIHFLERFAGDYGKAKKLEAQPAFEPALSQYRVAVVGSGPAGLCCAGELARRGIKVAVFESLQALGGVLRYGIPPFRLPRDILDYEISYLEKLGVEFIPNFIIGRTKGLSELFKEGFSAIFLGLGAGVPGFLGVRGENLCNIYSANEFLTRVNLMSAYKFPEFHTPINIGKKVVVIGGGNTAMDAARVALRLQKIRGWAADTAIIYRRTETELPARRLEIEHAKEEGVVFRFLVQPIEFLGDGQGLLKQMKSLQCQLGEPDESGRRRPVPIEGSEFAIDCEVAVIAVGLKANQVLTSVTPELRVDKYADIVVNPETMETSLKGVFAGGDIVGGEGTVIEAMGMAKKAAGAIIAYLLK
jgi:glutamate synthase (NADPH/NADH) small chain